MSSISDALKRLEEKRKSPEVVPFASGSETLQLEDEKSIQSLLSKEDPMRFFRLLSSVIVILIFMAIAFKGLYDLSFIRKEIFLLAHQTQNQDVQMTSLAKSLEGFQIRTKQTMTDLGEQIDASNQLFTQKTQEIDQQVEILRKDIQIDQGSIRKIDSDLDHMHFQVNMLEMRQQAFLKAQEELRQEFKDELANMKKELNQGSMSVIPSPGEESPGLKDDVKLREQPL